MRRIVLVLLLACAASGQWIFLRSEDVPRTAAGKLDGTAPAPRTPDGKPDLSGLWWPAGDTRPCPEHLGGREDCIEKGLGVVIERGSDMALAAVNVAAAVPGGLPYTPWAAELVRQRDLRPGVDDPHTHCLPSNLPRFYALPHLQRLVQTPKLLVMLNEFNASYRQVYLDGRALPQDPLPSWNGYSVGRWQGDTLVIETIGFRDDLWLDMRGNPLTSAAKITERLRRPNFGTLDIELTIDDPKAYTRPWTLKLQNMYIADTEMMDEVCLEGERDVQHMKGLR